MANITSGFSALKIELKFCSGGEAIGVGGRAGGKSLAAAGEGECELLLLLGVTVPTTVPYIL